MVEPPMDEEINLVDGIDQEYLCQTNLEVSNENHDEHGNEENSGNNQQILEPYNGMEFESLEEGLEYYTKYAKHKGFGIRRSRVTKSRRTQVIIGQEFVCSKEGHRAKKYVNREDRTQAAPDETRTGCKAMIYVSKKVGVDRWIISRFTRDHNHELATPKSASFLRAHRKRTRAQRNLIDVLDDSGVRPSRIMLVLATESGGIDKVGLTERDIQNYLSNKRQKQLEKGDAQLMLTYFRECQSKNPGFFYAIQMDAEGKLANCFWADSRSRIAYKYFGDAVTFDPTYLTNKYKMPFVPFTGVNHHHQSILFGCAPLWDETEETFVWLLKTWLEAMYGNHSKTIITDQDASISNAVAKVLPNSVHHYCMWHIEKKFSENLSHVYHKFDDFKSQFAKCIHNVLLPSEFESEWAAIMGKYGLQENSWLKKLYSIREKWIPAYVRSSFCAGMSTTQRSESMNKYFKDYVNASTPMSKFVIQYDKALDARYNKEREQSFKTMNSKPILKTMYPMEKEASMVYTRKIFRKFQDELIHSQEYVAEKINVVEQVYKYGVHEFDKKKLEYIVTFDVSSTTTACKCHMFEFVGIPCRHQLAVLIKKKVHSLPNHYFLDRWTRNSKKGEVDITSDHDNNAPTSSMMLFNSVMVHSLELSEKASRSQKHYDIAIGGLQRLFEELDALKIEDDKGNSPTDVVISKNVPEAVLRDEETHLLSQNSILLDPPHVTTKGRPKSIRKKGSLEQKKRCGSSAEITSDPNATKQVSSSHIDQDSNTPQNLNQGQGSMSLESQSHPTNSTDLTTTQAMQIGTSEKA
ncbi:hypothetical protein CCACVL1_02146 [Corchorus capsularis]|uniref:Protein FAR1-RELATED SEQUENCE n=1 Tax=Corchorus capsularis TaxID=210143 RepID=A0A1R3KC65_COCAP|nr:hypothetical protein CCACVL1_02146 [Corchorus capsularis]